MGALNCLKTPLDGSGGALIGWFLRVFRVHYKGDTAAGVSWGMRLAVVCGLSRLPSGEYSTVRYVTQCKPLFGTSLDSLKKEQPYLLILLKSRGDFSPALKLVPPARLWVLQRKCLQQRTHATARGSC